MSIIIGKCNTCNTEKCLKANKTILNGLYNVLFIYKEENKIKT
jgi:hypothetical protein